jgi:hypothetical protein
MSNENKVYQKYVIQKTDGTEVSPDARYFVLRLDKDDEWSKHCRRALHWMAKDMSNHGFNEQLAKEISNYAFENSPAYKKAVENELNNL